MALRETTVEAKERRHEYRCDETETSSVFGDRVEMYARSLHGAGEEQKAIKFSTLVKVKTREIRKRFTEEVNRGETLLTFRAYSVTALDTKAYLDEASEEESMIALHAWSEIAQVSRDLLRATTLAQPTAYGMRKDEEYASYQYNTNGAFYSTPLTEVEPRRDSVVLPGRPARCRGAPPVTNHLGDQAQARKGYLPCSRPLLPPLLQCRPSSSLISWGSLRAS